MAKKLLIVFFVVVYATAQNYAQEVVYTVTGIYNNEPTALDSILVENLTNDTKILFGPLPAHEKYLINLTHKMVTSVYGIDDEGPVFSVAQNSAGILKLKYTKNFPTSVKIAVYNINGQSLYSSQQKSINPGNTVSVKLGASGVYLVKIDSPGKVETFKAIGSGNLQNYEVGVDDIAKNSVDILKSTDPPKVFEFNMGDSLRISAYKKDLYAWPEGTRIEGPAPVDFQFKQSTVETTGISDAYIPLNENTTSISNYNASTGDLEIEFTGEQPELRPGGIITIDLDTMGYLRKIVSIKEENGTYFIDTEQAYFNDLFKNKKFKLHTRLITPKNGQLKSTSSLSEIAEALTDEDGYIHPVKVIYTDERNEAQTKSAFDYQEDRYELINFHENLECDIYGDENDNVHFYIEEGYIDAKLDAVFEFDLTYDPELLEEDTKVQKGDLETFKFYLEGKVSLLTKLVLDMKNNFNKRPDEKRIINMPELKAHFVVPPAIPVWINFDTDIYGKYSFESSAMLNADWGFEINHTVQAGGIYDAESESFSPIKNYTPENIIYPLNICGEVNARARFEVFPRIDVLFYGFFGPYAEIAPFIEGHYNARVQSQITTASTETFLGWDSGIDLGLDVRIGAMLDLWLWNKRFDPKSFNLFTKPLWNSPKSVEITTNLPTELSSGSIQKLNLKVSDVNYINQSENPVALCPIYVFGDGEFSNQISLTDFNGEASIDWILPNTEGIKKITAVIFDSNKDPISIMEKSVNIKSDYLVSNGSFTDSRDGEEYDWVKIGNQIWMGENIRHLPKGENLAPPSMPITNLSTIDYSDTYTKPYYYVYGSSGLFHDYIETQATMQQYGVLYNYTAAKTACPREQGWRLPTDSDWKELEEYIGNKYGYNKNSEYDYWEQVGSRLKSKTWGVDDIFGFNALPGGMRDRETGSFNGLGNATYWWSSTPWLSDCSYERHLYNNDRFHRSHLFNHYGLSVRCIKD